MEVVGQIKGVGVLTALAFLLILEDKNRFQKSRDVGAFIGLRPKKKASGKDDPQLRITKEGDQLLRRLLVQSAHYILGPFGMDSDLRRWGLGICKRGGKAAKKRARIAVARKLSVLMHRLWIAGEIYEPIGYNATTVEEPGSTGTDWRVHYCLSLPDLRCDFYELTDNHSAETYKRVPVSEGDIILGDRGYSHREGVARFRKLFSGNPSHLQVTYLT